MSLQVTYENWRSEEVSRARHAYDVERQLADLLANHLELHAPGSVALAVYRHVRATAPTDAPQTAT